MKTTTRAGRKRVSGGAHPAYARMVVGVQMAVEAAREFRKIGEHVCPDTGDIYCQTCHIADLAEELPVILRTHRDLLESELSCQTEPLFTAALADAVAAVNARVKGGAA